MNVQENSLDELCINTIRFLAVDAVQQANSGHPGMPMGCADFAALLWGKILKHALPPKAAKYVRSAWL